MVLVCFGVFPLWIMNDLPNSSWFPPRPSMLNFPTLYRVCHLPGYFGWVDLDLERIAALLQVMNVNFFVCKSLPGSSPSPSSSSSRSLPMLIKLFLCHFLKHLFYWTSAGELIFRMLEWFDPCDDVWDHDRVLSQCHFHLRTWGNMPAWYCQAN